jgi:hypothetical protein
VLVRVFQARVNDNGRRRAVETLFELFFGDAGNRHGCYCDRAVPGCQLNG